MGSRAQSLAPQRYGEGMPYRARLWRRRCRQHQSPIIPHGSLDMRETRPTKVRRLEFREETCMNMVLNFCIIRSFLELAGVTFFSSIFNPSCSLFHFPIVTLDDSLLV
jgi:hypothetical protein